MVLSGEENCCSGSHSLLHIVTSGGGRELNARDFMGDAVAVLALSENGGFLASGPTPDCDLDTIRTKECKIV